MADDFYPFVDSGDEVTSNHHITSAQRTPFAQVEADAEVAEGASADSAEMVHYPARIAVYDDMLSTPRVIVIEPKDIRSYLEEITNTVNACVREQGGKIPFMVIREIVENFIHAYFIEPTVSILNGGNTLRFADQGPGIANKKLALEAGMTSANEHMKRYIRGVGSGFPTVQQYLEMAGGTLTIEDNMNKGTVVTVSLADEKSEGPGAGGGAADGAGVGTPTGAWPAQNPAQNPAQPSGAWNGGVAGAWPYPGGAYAQPQAAYNPYGAAAPGQAVAPQMQNPWMYPQNYGFPQSFPQAGPMFSTPQQPAVSPQTAPGAQMGAAVPYISERGHLALRFMAENGSGGPTELARAFGSSNATWSRELATLADTGLAIKHGQKYLLTTLGSAYAENGVA